MVQDAAAKALEQTWEQVGAAEAGAEHMICAQDGAGSGSRSDQQDVGTGRRVGCSGQISSGVDETAAG